jgi:pyruvate dehydrogenase E2 component (dihydrolipoamide acetyltransferase)
MAIAIKVPRLGWNMEQGTFRGWLKREGELVRAGDPLYTLEGDKAVEEIEATDGGILRQAPNGPREGDVIAVGAVVGYLAAQGESVDLAAAIVSSTRETELAPQPMPQPKPLAVPSRRPITPRARKAAQRLGVDWALVQGSGRTGRIRERDIVKHAAASSDRPRDRTLDPLRLRRVIAERMVQSLRTTAPVTLTTTVDATNLVNLRSQFKAAAGAAERVVPSVTDFFVRLAARALQVHPGMNSRWQDDRVVTSAEIHIGLAVDTEAGLLVPVVRDVARLSLQQVAQRSRDLIDRARALRLRSEELQGGTFTITNLGAFGIDAFTPIINSPECAILGVGRIRKTPAVVDNQVMPRDVVTLNLTFDHRLVDGAPAARFLQTLGQGVENPAPWLMD